MERQRKLQNELKIELELLSGGKLSPSDVWNAYLNLSGFFRVLQQMKKEAEYAKTI